MDTQVDLFGNKTERKALNRKHNVLFNDYDSFIDKFKRKLTTDDCYTPTAVYDCVVDYVRRKCHIDGLEIIRPFYPDMDYRDVLYYDDQVVIDNPPFSIISQIARFYVGNNVKFFLFAPHLTLFSADIDCTKLVVGASIIYKNGANVKTSFLSNLFDDIAIIADHEFYEELESINKVNKPILPKYKYPSNVATVSNIHKLVTRGVSLSFHKNDVYFCRQLDCQKKRNKAMFGSGYLLSEKAAAEKAAAEEIIVWELSDREREIIKTLLI